jgi:hypothetical protein
MSSSGEVCIAERDHRQVQTGAEDLGIVVTRSRVHACRAVLRTTKLQNVSGVFFFFFNRGKGRHKCKKTEEVSRAHNREQWKNSRDI